jgi:hypothetical protein
VVREEGDVSACPKEVFARLPSRSAKRVYRSIDELQADLDLSASTMNSGRIREAGALARRRCRPSLTRCPFLGAMSLAKEKVIVIEHQNPKPVTACQIEFRLIHHN